MNKDNTNTVESKTSYAQLFYRFSQPRIPFTITTIVILIWSCGRSIEVIKHQVIFKGVVIYLLGWTLWLLLAVVVIGIFVRLILTFKEKDQKLWKIIVWILFTAFIGYIVFRFAGFRIGAIGLYAGLSGFTTTSLQSYYALFKLFPEHPMLLHNGINLLISDAILNSNRLKEFLWGGDSIAIIFISFCVIGMIVLLFAKGKRLSSLIFSVASGTALALHMKMKDLSVIDGFIYFHAATIVLSISLFLLFYSFARFKAQSTHILPPPTIILFFTMILFTPLIADIYNQFKLELGRRELIADMGGLQTSESMVVTAATLNVRTGPFSKKEIVGSVHIGDQVNVLKIKNGWSKIGNERWVFSKYLKKRQAFTLLRGINIYMKLPNRNQEINLVIGLLDPKNGIVVGRYKYAGFVEWLTLKGKFDPNGYLSLTEQDPKGKITGKLMLWGSCINRLRKGNPIQEQCDIEGKWSSPDGFTNYSLSALNSN